MTTTTRTISNLGDQGAVTVSGRAGRLLFALLLSPGTSDSLSMLANVPKKLLPACVDELTLALEEEQAPDPNAVGAKGGIPSEESITHNDTNVSGTDPEPAAVDPEEVVLAACKAADQAKDPKAQALAVIDAWRLFFPNLANHEEITRKQDLSPRKAREWIVDVVKPVFPGSEATTVFGWMSGVDEGKLLSMQFPLAWVESRVVNKSKEAQAKPQSQGDEVMDGWRQYARKVIEQGGSNVQDREGNLLRIARRVKRSPEEPS